MRMRGREIAACQGDRRLFGEGVLVLVITQKIRPHHIIKCHNNYNLTPHSLSLSPSPSVVLSLGTQQSTFPPIMKLVLLATVVGMPFPQTHRTLSCPHL